MEKGARDGKACGAMAFALNFFWLLFLFQDKKSDKSTIQPGCYGKIPLLKIISFFQIFIPYPISTTQTSKKNFHPPLPVKQTLT